MDIIEIVVRALTGPNHGDAPGLLWLAFGVLIGIAAAILTGYVREEIRNREREPVRR